MERRDGGKREGQRKREETRGGSKVDVYIQKALYYMA